MTGETSGRVLLECCQSRYVWGDGDICPFREEGNCHTGDSFTWKSLPGIGLRSIPPLLPRKLIQAQGSILVIVDTQMYTYVW